MSEGFAAEGELGSRLWRTLDYHASLNQSSSWVVKSISAVAYYHLVPNPSNALFMRFFERDLPDNYLTPGTGCGLTCPGSKDIEVTGR